MKFYHEFFADRAVTEMARAAPYWTLAAFWNPVFDPIRDHLVYLQMLRDQNLEGATPQWTPRPDSGVAP